MNYRQIGQHCRKPRAAAEPAADSDSLGTGRQKPSCMIADSASGLTAVPSSEFPQSPKEVKERAVFPSAGETAKRESTLVGTACWYRSI